MAVPGSVGGGASLSGMTNWNGCPPLRSLRLRRTVKRAHKAGLIVTATTNGVHSSGSWHYKKRAVDFGLPAHLIGTDEGLHRLRSFQREEFNRAKKVRFRGYLEIIGPINHLIVLIGRPTSLAEGSELEQMHDNHVHIAR